MFKCYRQLESSDCGLTCIRMIARHYGKKVPLHHLQQITDLNRLGMSIRDITNCFGQIGMDSQAVKINTAPICNMPLPAILYWQQRHFVVLYKFNASKGKYYIADPAQGKISYNAADFEKYWIPEGGDKGLAILAEPREDFYSREYDEENNLKQFLAYLTQFLKGHRFGFTAALLITILIMAADFAIPVLLRRTVDEGIGLKDVGLVAALLLGQLAVTMGELVSSSGLNLILTKTGLGINLEMINNFVERLARFPLSFFDRKVSSDFVQKINDQSRIKDFLVSFPNSVVSMALTLVVFSILLCHYSPLIFAVFMVMSVMEIGWNALFLNHRKTLDYALFTNLSENRNYSYELTNGMADLKVNNAEKSRITKWVNTQRRLNEITMKSTWLNLAQGGGQSVITRIKDLSITGLSALLVIQGEMTFGVMLTLGYITGRLTQPISEMSTSIRSLQDAILSYLRIHDVIDDNTCMRGNRKFSNPTISFSGVWFKYAGSASPFVIKDFSLSVEQGKTIALVGESGCGKSTLIKLMLGFYIPQQGSLELSGHPVAELDNSDWLRHCGAVQQDARVFTGTILENISFSDEKPDIEKARRVVETVGLTSFINSLPMNIHTRLGVSGIELSGGQRQRIMIARALYKEPDILFLDEATSSLDANNERMIIENVGRTMRGRTLVVAAHRLSTIQNADKIIFIKDGQIAEMGTHQELIARKGLYHDLVKNQMQPSEQASL